MNHPANYSKGEIPKVSVMIIDSDFNVEKEVLLPKNVFPPVQWVDGSGVYFLKNQEQENRLKFCKMTLTY